MADKWDRRMLGLAKFVAGWSKDPSTKVGAVFTKDRRVLSLGFNGLPQGISDEETYFATRELKLETIIHAEINALVFARSPLTGATLYTYPFQTCSRCASVMIQAGVVRVVAPPPLEHWVENCKISSQLLQGAGVELEIVEDFA